MNFLGARRHVLLGWINFAESLQGLLNQAVVAQEDVEGYYVIWAGQFHLLLQLAASWVLGNCEYDRV